MSMRIFSLGLCFVVTACGVNGDDKVVSAKPDDRIECAVAGAKDFTQACAIDRSADGKTMVLRHSDGGFRRIDLAPDGALSAADGADAVIGRMLPDGRFELVAGADRYRLPPRS